MKKVKKRNGQAAMEFLMTYGWAILVVLAAIAALAYFGVLSPGNFLPSSCTIASGFSCEDFKVNSTDVQLILRNGLGDDLSSVTVAVAACTASAEADGNDSWSDGANLGDTDGITLGVCSNGNVGNRFSEDIAITYTSGSGIEHTVTGKLTTKVE